MLSLPAVGTAQQVGPDGFGYVATGTAALPLGVRGTAGAFVLNFTNTDDGSVAINLGVNSFRYYGVSYSGNSKLFVSTNGLLTIGSANTTYDNGDLTSLPAEPAIAVLWDDWKMGAGGATFGRFDDTNLDGIADRLVLEWSRVIHSSLTGEDVTFQAALSLNPPLGEQSSIFLNYPDLLIGPPFGDGSVSATVGIKGAGTQGANRLLISQDGSPNSLVQNNRGILIAVPEPSALISLCAGALALIHQTRRRACH